jgi:hypothetical protein
MQRWATVMVVLLAGAGAAGCAGSGPGSGRAFELTPPGLASADGPRMAALCEGKLVGALANGKVRTWLEGEAHRRVLVAWPRTYRAHLHPLEVLDERGRVVARAGEFVRLGGGFMHPGASGDAFVTWGA